MENSLFVTCGEGLDNLLLEELRALGCTDLKIGFRGIYVYGASLEDIYRINYCSRIATRVLLPISNFKVFNARTLYKNISDIDWSQYVNPHKTFSIDANVSHYQIRNSLFAAQVVKDAICDQFRRKLGVRPSIDTKNPHVQLNLFIRDPHAVISLDTSREPLHKRGYRQDTVDAPIKETLAAALLDIVNPADDAIIFDPCCGSGTLLIEAALRATRTPPGFLRTEWGFMHMPGFSQIEWLKVKNQADAKKKALPVGRLFGCDISKNAIRVCKTNLRAAGFHQAIDVIQYDFRDYTPQVPPSLVFTNPPHGKRLETVESLKELYRSLGSFMKEKTAKPAKGFIFAGNLELAKEVGLAPAQRHVMFNSGEEARFLEFDLYKD